MLAPLPTKKLKRGGINGSSPGGGTPAAGTADIAADPVLERARVNNYIRLRRSGYTPEQAQAEMATRLSRYGGQKAAERVVKNAAPQDPARAVPPTPGGASLSPTLPGVLTPFGATPATSANIFTAKKKRPTPSQATPGGGTPTVKTRRVPAVPKAFPFAVPPSAIMDPFFIPNG